MPCGRQAASLSPPLTHTRDPTLGTLSSKRPPEGNPITHAAPLRDPRMTLRGEGLLGATWWSEMEVDWWAQRDSRPQEVDGSHRSTDWALSSGGAGLGDQGQAPQGSRHVHSASPRPRAGQGPPRPLRRVPTTEGLWPPRESRGTPTGTSTLNSCDTHNPQANDFCMPIGYTILRRVSRSLTYHSKRFMLP